MAVMTLAKYAHVMMCAGFCFAAASHLSSLPCTGDGLRLRGGLGPKPKIGPFGGRAQKAASGMETARGQVELDISVSVHHIRSIHAPTTRVVMVGNLPELGDWDPSKGVSLTTSDVDYPIFRGKVVLPPEKSVEYKYVVVAEGGDTEVKQQWEAVNRPLKTDASDASMVIRNEFNEFRGTDPRLTDEPFQLTAQEWSRWYKHHQSQMVTFPGNYSAHMQTTECHQVEL